jgi:hypothetical protein
MLITVQGKDFIINLVNNYVMTMYTELTDESSRLGILSDELTEMAMALENIKIFTQERKDAEKALKEKQLELRKSRDTIVNLRDKIIEELCESNDIDYDEKWWSRKTGLEDLNDFMIACVKKDADLFKGHDLKKK